jgi:hypothetical protein
MLTTRDNLIKRKHELADRITTLNREEEVELTGINQILREYHVTGEEEWTFAP